MGCTLASPDEYDLTVRVRQLCDLMSNYFDHLLLLLVLGGHKHKAIGLIIKLNKIKLAIIMCFFISAVKLLMCTSN